MNVFLSAIGFAANTGHLAMLCNSSLHMRQGSLGLENDTVSFDWALVLKVFALLDSF